MRARVNALRQRDVELVHFLTDGALPHDAQGQCTSTYRHRSVFIGNDVRAADRIHKG